MKEFSDLRTSLQESVENLEEHSNILQGAMPPNILILRRKSVRQFPDHTMVALYYNDKLDQYFSIPYGGDAETAITPGSLKEEEEKPKTSQEKEIERHEKTVKLWANRKQRWNAFKQTQISKKPLSEDAISHLQKVKAFQTDKPLHHKDGSQTKVDPTSAHALLTVHDALHPDNRKKFADALEHSKTKFHKMLDFTWKQVK